MSWWIALLLLGEASAECLSSARATDASSALERAESAYADLEMDQFMAAVQDLSLLMPCLAETLDPVTAARFHRVDAIRVYAEGQEEDARSSLWTARVLQPSYEFPDELLPQGHALRSLYRTISVDFGEQRRLAEPRTGWVSVDGQVSRFRPIERPFLFQLVGDDGTVRETAVVRPGGRVPEYRATPRARRTLFTVAGSTAAASAVAYGVAWQANQAFYDTSGDPTREQIDSRRARANTAFSLSIALGAGAVACGVAGLLAPQG